ncbi:hypothetical protein ACFQ3C_17575 [Seohaeicola saemankumensis]|uniref:Uncharacterized protein n=1 Tax=Seohaeicola saemankumensis TaxID=481181 RepID=A0ABW3TIZ4_9RHOB
MNDLTRINDRSVQGMVCSKGSSEEELTMSDGKIVASILLGLVAVATGGIAALLLVQTLSGLGGGGLAFTGIPILVLGGICALSVVGIAKMNKGED